MSPILWWGDIQTWSETSPAKTGSAYGNDPFQDKKELQAFLGITTYLHKFSPSMVWRYKMVVGIWSYAKFLTTQILPL